MKRFNSLAVIFAAGVGVSQIAFAGQAPYVSKEVAPVQPECSWTGWYIGLHFGGGRSSVDWRPLDDLSAEIEATQDVTNIFGGLQLGYNRQINDWLVWGWEITAAGGGLEDRHHILFPSGETDEESFYRAKNDFTGKLSMRVGFTGMNNHPLFYVKVVDAITHRNHEYHLTKTPS